MSNNQSPDDRPGTSVISFGEAKALAEKHGTPLLVCDLQKVEDNYKRLKNLLRRFELYYAVKANPHPKILKRLHRLGSHYDVASKNEMIMCQQIGAKSEDLLYANPVKPVESIKFAYEQNIRTFTYDNVNEIDKMAKYAPGSNVILRIMVKDAGSTCKFSTKFGARERDALSLLTKAKAKALNPIGLSFHVGSQCLNIDQFGWALDICSAIFKSAERKDIDLSVLDIGGGIPIRYIDDVYPIEELADMINEKVEDLFPPWVRPIAEPGRVIVGDSTTLITRVVGVTKRHQVNCAYIDDGVYNSLSEKVFGHCEYDILSDQPGEKKQYTIFGPTCDSMDIVTDKAKLPQLEVGDLLLVPSTGAYTNAAATYFNGFDPAEIIFLNE